MSGYHVLRNCPEAGTMPFDSQRKVTEILPQRVSW